MDPFINVNLVSDCPVNYSPPCLSVHFWLTYQKKISFMKMEESWTSEWSTMDTAKLRSADLFLTNFQAHILFPGAQNLLCLSTHFYCHLSWSSLQAFAHTDWMLQETRQMHSGAGPSHMPASGFGEKKGLLHPREHHLTRQPGRKIWCTWGHSTRGICSNTNPEAQPTLAFLPKASKMTRRKESGQPATGTLKPRHQESPTLGT